MGTTWALRDEAKARSTWVKTSGTPLAVQPKPKQVESSSCFPPQLGRVEQQLLLHTVVAWCRRATTATALCLEELFHFTVDQQVHGPKDVLAADCVGLYVRAYLHP